MDTARRTWITVFVAVTATILLVKMASGRAARNGHCGRCVVGIKPLNSCCDKDYSMTRRQAIRAVKYGPLCHRSHPGDNVFECIASWWFCLEPFDWGHKEVGEQVYAVAQGWA